jgi:iron complex transport system substrate-binding protein
MTLSVFASTPRISFSFFVGILFLFSMPTVIAQTINPVNKSEIKVVTLSPHLAEIVRSLDLEKNLVGVSAYSNFPETLKSIPIVGDALSLNLERLKSLRPDVILIWKSGMAEPHKNKLRQAFAKTNTQIIESDATTLDQIPDEIERLGKILGRDEVSKKIARDYRQEVTELRRRYSNKSTLKVFYQAWPSPLITIHQNHLIGDMAKTCGGRLIFNDQKLITSTVSPEQVIALNPDVMMTAIDGNSKNPESSWSIWKKYPTLSVNQLNGYLSIQGDLLTRPTPRSLTATKLMCVFFDGIRLRQNER